jgi:dipeptidyl aminopeptidase/acylaminoacyl peptidase
MTAMYDEAAEFIRQGLVHQLGGTPSDVPDEYVEGSPITHAEHVEVPLLVIHGRDDIRCPAGQMERYLARLDALGKDVTVEWFDAGHLGGVADPSLDLHHTSQILTFVQRALAP